MKRKDVDECLEIIWHLGENHGDTSLDSFKKHTDKNYGEETLRKLESLGHITIFNNNILVTPKGKTHAKQVVRCHRLAERLLSDVLGMKPEEVEKGACEFEHILAPELVSSICTLLGHPKCCPHGTPIPEGDCCKSKQLSVGSAVMPLTEGKTGDMYTVAYINSQTNSRLQKLLNFQILPGVEVKVTQKYPSYVIQGKNIQLALDKDIIDDIHVWKNETAMMEIKDPRKVSKPTAASTASMVN
ncbi:MAG: metal-dependent transcriptional regulator [Bacteriovoracaceae bacterium]|nr:metal-dependent transcriptional regulator [Bacteriovoracaceae bacterium]